MASPPLLFDTHLHLDTEAPTGETFSAARAAGVTRFLLAGTELLNSRHVSRIARREPGVFAAVGVHPHEASTFHSLSPFREILRRDEVVAVGEIGLDYHYDHSPRDVQRKVFRGFLELAAATGFPPLIHCREAFADCLAMVRDHFPRGRPLLIHSFTGDPEQAGHVLALGGTVSFNGMVTFKNAANIRATLAVVPPERLLLETDAPWLAPAPYRGKPNRPAHLVEIARKVAELKDLPLQRLAEITTRNACFFFGLPET